MSVPQLPPGAPYTVSLGEPVEIRVYPSPSDAEDVLYGALDFRGDRFGGSVDLGDLGPNETEETAIDRMVADLARLVWHELGGTPVFREEDANWTGRVEVQAPWLAERRTPSMGLLANEGEVRPARDEPEPEPEMVGAPETNGPPVWRGELTLNDDELALIARGEIPQAVAARALKLLSAKALLTELRELLFVADAPPQHEKRVRLLLNEIEDRLGV